MPRKARISAAMVSLMGGGERHAWTLDELHGDLARQGRATTLCLTNCMKSPITAQADMALYAAPSEVKYFQAPLASRITQLALVDALFVSIALRRKNRTLAQLQSAGIKLLGGAKLAYAAFERSEKAHPATPPMVGGFTPEQEFFLAFAQDWCTNYRPEALRLQVSTNPHSPSQFRVIGPLANLPEFAQAFQCKAGDKMVRGGDKQCVVW